MQKLIGILFFFISFNLVVLSQDTTGTWNPEKKTYDLYMQKNWSELIRYGKIALKEGYDYYYLRMRLAIAFYERKNYHRALIHFRKATEFSNKDPYLLEYMYFANLFSGREKAALDITRDFTPSMRKKFGTSQIPRFHIGSLGLQINTSNLQTGPELVSGIIDPALNGYQIFSNYLFRAHLGFNHLVSKRFSLLYQYGFMLENRFMFYQKDLLAYYISGQNLFQHQLYLRSNLYLGKGFNLNAAIHYLPGSIPAYYTSSRPSYSNYVPSYRYNDFTGHLSVFKDFSYLSFGLSTSYSYLNFRNFLQEGISVSMYPLGNLNLYLTLGYHVQQELLKNGVIHNGRFTNFKFGFKFIYPVWLEVSGSFGDLHYTVSQLGWQVMNGPNPISQQIGGSILIPLKSENVLFSLNYSYINTTSNFILSDQGLTSINSINYNIHSIYGGLSWKF